MGNVVGGNRHAAKQTLDTFRKEAVVTMSTYCGVETNKCRLLVTLGIGLKRLMLQLATC